ncbi:MAG TPA: tRNA (cytidine(34)-2'-O)-methyltransferase [Gammaproteobacteria bacterium]|nr:tRNA (cytidine(34)-2'-O)-methyltransferase [Gammaproteobacteria bacterium]
MFHIILYQPEIPPNTGNIIRLCANSGARLHLIRPLGFELDDRRLRRAGLDYHELAVVETHPDLATCLERAAPRRLFACTTRGDCVYSEAAFAPGDALLFGPESRGLPAPVLKAVKPERRLRIPMQPGRRSLNLSNAVAIVLYEAWRQTGFGIPSAAE